MEGSASSSGSRGAGTLAWPRAGIRPRRRALAVLSGRDFVTPDDVKGVAGAALAHRITLKPELWMRRIDPASVVADICHGVAAPQTAQAPVYSAQQ